jgi:hypothetical protein
MTTLLRLLPALACGAGMCVPMAVGMTRGWLRRRRERANGELIGTTGF